MKKVHIFFTAIDKAISEKSFNQYLQRLPSKFQDKVLRYKRHQDKCLYLFGKILLLEALQMYNIPVDKLKTLKYTEYSRPFIDEAFDFNISHSGKYVICGCGTDINLGVDIEQIRSIEINNFSNAMNKEQWEKIKSSHDPKQTFFKYWTFKESITKADGRGLSIPLTNITFNDYNRGYYDGKYWYITDFIIDNDYYACIATNIPNISISLHRLNV